MKTTVTISGMHCASCASNIERSLKKIKNIDDVKVSLLMKKAYLESKEKIDENEIREAVSKTGYKVTDIKEL